MNNKNSRTGLATSLLLHGAVFLGIWWVVNQPQEKPPEEIVTSISMEMLAANLEQPQVAVAPPQPEETPAPEPQSEKVAEPEAVAEPVAIPKPIEKPKVKEKPKEPPKEKIKEKPQDKPKEKPKTEPKEEKPKPKEKLKEKPKEKPKDPTLEKPKEKVKAEKPTKPIKALETGIVAKEGIIAKAIPNATQGIKAQAGVPNAKVGGTSPVANGQGNAAGSNVVNQANKVASVSSTNANANEAYKQGLQRLLARKAKSNYPPREKMMRKQGIVMVNFMVSPSGQLTNATVVSSSGVAGLDAAAIKIANSTSYEPPPAGLTKFTVPIKFEIE